MHFRLCIMTIVEFLSSSMVGTCTLSSNIVGILCHSDTTRKLLGLPTKGSVDIIPEKFTFFKVSVTSNCLPVSQATS